MLTISKTKENDKLTIDVTGRLDTTTAPAWHPAFL